MASGFVTSAGKQWAGMYDCGSGNDYGKPTTARSSKATKTRKGEEREPASEHRRETAAEERAEGEY